ncbi:uncharacterized protein LOC143154881 [Ptiloglossa arizonensis]|uniref:uncharacterized protein LOC143154881 n=1 Tax=Ptiloglossa arizonensis TaxID=3350558 RepID=UPI003F9FC233
MSDKLVIKDNRIKAEVQNHSKMTLDIKSFKLSERMIPNIQISRKTYSEIQIESDVDYDDLCGSWIYSKNPAYSWYVKPPNPSICIWQYFTEQDVIYLKKYQMNKKIISSFFENKFINENKRKSNDILVKELYEFFKFTRLHSFTEKGISVVLGLVYLMHLFFLSHPWWTAKEIFKFFYETLSLHIVLNPPKSLEVFTIAQSNLLLRAFHEIYMENLVLLRILYHTNYHLIMNINNPASSTKED